VFEFLPRQIYIVVPGIVVFMAKFRKASRARRVYGFAKRTAHRSKTSGVLGDVVAGAAVGIGLSLANNTINKYVPSIGPVRPTSAALTGVGLAGKMLHKGGKYTDAALIMGAAMTATDVLGGVLGGKTGGNSSSNFWNGV